MSYAKFLLAVLITVIAGVVAAMTGDGVISHVGWINIAIAGVGSLRGVCGSERSRRHIPNQFWQCCPRCWRFSCRRLPMESQPRWLLVP